MKIGFDAKRANANNTGLGNYSRFIIEALAQYAPENEYQLYVPKHKRHSEYEALLNEYTSLEERLPSKGVWRGLLSSVWRTLSIRSDLRREGVEIFHGLSNEIPLGMSNSNTRTVVTIHDLIFLRIPSIYKPLDRWIYNLKFRYACRRADRVIAVSECTKRDIVELYNVSPERITVIYQWCAPHFATTYDEATLQDVRAKYNLPQRFILNVGTLEERKNLMLCVKALEKLPADIHLVACGRATPYSDKVMQYASKQGIADRIHLIHNCSYADLPIVYQCAEVFLYPSRYEGFGIPIIEALSCGVPVVAATGSCLEEAGGDAASYVNPDDDVACAKAIARFLDDIEHRNGAITRGKKYVERFSKESIAGEIAELYRGMM